MSVLGGLHRRLGSSYLRDKTCQGALAICLPHAIVAAKLNTINTPILELVMFLFDDFRDEVVRHWQSRQTNDWWKK